MLTVGLTGSVAAGKSAVADLWREAGVPVVSADALAREVVAPGSEGLAAVRRAFGDDVVAPDGTLDRDAVRDRVFRDEEARRTLEALLHPRIRARQQAWLADRAREGAPLAVAEIPLLFEVGREGEFDVVVVVDAPEPVRLARMLADRGLEAGEARRIMAAQADPVEKRRRADFVVENGGSRIALREAALAVLKRLRERAAEKEARR